MKLIVGLGNPGKNYEKTRHNAGFMALDKLSQNFKLQKKLQAETAEAILDGRKILLAKPQTFMNESGRAVASIKNFYKLDNAEILVVHDEVDLEFGTIRLSKSSGSAGHKGVESIINNLGNDVPRLRIGVDTRKSREEIPTEEYVLKNFTKEELKRLEDEIIPEAVEKIEEWIVKNSKLQAPNHKQ